MHTVTGRDIESDDLTIDNTITQYQFSFGASVKIFIRMRCNDFNFPELSLVVVIRILDPVLYLYYIVCIHMKNFHCRCYKKSY